ncbi:MAG: hypothetical protein IKZ61_10320 [Prevotella sp.]|nr:hypothetical protein [Prevotella sp.]
MKKILFSIVALCFTMVAGAQNSSQIVSAVLQTGDETKVFYGQGALTSAYNAAENGSVITLTSGTFTSPGNIKKSVSIYGVGFEDNVTEGMQKTYITGELVYAADSDGNPLKDIVLEGVHVESHIWIKEISGMTIAKCRFAYLEINGAGVEAILVRQCYLNGFDARSNVVAGVTFKNSILLERILGIPVGSQVLFDHCILTYWYRYSSAAYHYIASYTNCIINNNHGLEANSYAEKNIFLQLSSHDNIISVDNWFSIDVSTLFGDGVNDLSYTTTRTFILAAPDTYKGTDGTPVGVTGGDFPWYKAPSTPYVKNLNATVDGINLDVDYDAGVRSTNPPTE